MQVRPAGGGLPQLVQFPQMAQTIPIQVPISNGNGQTILQTIHVPLQSFASQIPGIQLQPQMQVISQMPQVANIITPSGQIQQVQLAPINHLTNLQAAQAAASGHPQNVILQQAVPNMATSSNSNQNGGVNNMVSSVPTSTMQVILIYLFI